MAELSLIAYAKSSVGGYVMSIQSEYKIKRFNKSANVLRVFQLYDVSSVWGLESESVYV